MSLQFIRESLMRQLLVASGSHSYSFLCPTKLPAPAFTGFPGHCFWSRRPTSFRSRGGQGPQPHQPPGTRPSPIVSMQTWRPQQVPSAHGSLLTPHLITKWKHWPLPQFPAHLAFQRSCGNGSLPWTQAYYVMYGRLPAYVYQNAHAQA